VFTSVRSNRGPAGTSLISIVADEFNDGGPACQNSSKETALDAAAADAALAHDRPNRRASIAFLARTSFMPSSSSR